MHACMCVYIYVCVCPTYIYMYMATPPHDTPSPLKHRPHRRLRAFPEVSSFSHFVCPEPHPSRKKKRSFTENAGTVLLFGFLDFQIFGYLVFWFCYVVKTKNPKKTKIQKNKNPKKQNCPRMLRETLVLCFFGFGCILVPVTASAFMQIIIPLLKLS